MSGTDRASENWSKATEALIELDGRSRRGAVSDHDALYALSHVVSHLVAAVGALILERTEELA